MDAARRELEEELGLVANELRPPHTFYPNPGRSAWPVHTFVSSSGATADRSDTAEQIRVVRMGVQELDGRISSGEIVDPSLIVARAAAAISGALPLLVFGPIRKTICSEAASGPASNISQGVGATSTVGIAGD